MPLDYYDIQLSIGADSVGVGGAEEKSYTAELILSCSQQV